MLCACALHGRNLTQTNTSVPQVLHLSRTQPPFKFHHGNSHHRRRPGPNYPSARGGRGTRFELTGKGVAYVVPQATNLLVSETFVLPSNTSMISATRPVSLFSTEISFLTRVPIYGCWCDFSLVLRRTIVLCCSLAGFPACRSSPLGSHPHPYIAQIAVGGRC